MTPDEVNWLLVLSLLMEVSAGVVLFCAVGK